MAETGKAEQEKVPANIRKLLAVAKAKRNKNQQTQLRNYFVSLHPEAKRMQAEMDDLQKQLDGLAPPKSLVMRELDEPRPTTVLMRGNFLTPGDQVEAGTPEVLPPVAIHKPEAQARNSNPSSPTRLHLARWLVDAANPLTPRVQVNRAWAQFFGRGIVASEEDFGTQAEEPTHPDVLNWLAAEFRNHQWSLKRVHRRIVESATYRQSSKFRSDLAARDPKNLLLARGPRVRLTAELIRDNALAIAGRLSSKMHGPPVYPPQPEGVWRVTGLVDNTYRESTGDDAWRRGVYTVWRRSAPYPSFMNFDAPDRAACVVKRPRSNTPLQALTLQNDPVYVELARDFADRIVGEGRSLSSDEQLSYVFRTAVARRPREAELKALRDVCESAGDRYRGDGTALKSVIGKHVLPTGVSAIDWAAWFNVAQVLLNLDETITKN